MYEFLLLLCRFLLQRNFAAAAWGGILPRSGIKNILVIGKR